ncbi:hypothetical protein CEP53_007147 [Fusarium sp. AF-6]|nr:hypothetical protein CEP53_007147 [Fusarium sp. AF-6]
MIPAVIKCTESQILSVPLPPESLSFSLEVFDTMEDDDTRSFSLISTVGIESTHTLTDQDTDEFELVYDEERSECSRWDLSSSCSTSLSPSIHGYEYACGRRYHSYMSGRYPLPNDNGEQLREETEHALFLHLLSGKLFLSDIGESPRKIIDIGTGTGTWAIDVADLYPNASVVGTDLSPIQPESMPLNAQMFVEDCEDPEWAHGNNFDLVHLRGVAGFLLDIDAVVDNAHEHLRYGGWIEFQEFDYSVLCDDNTMEQDDPVRIFFDTCAEGIREFGCVGFGKHDIKQSLKRVGFRRIQMVTKKVPLSSWPGDKKSSTVGTLMQANISECLEAFAAKPLVAMGMTPEQRHEMVSRARESLLDSSIRRYVNCHFYMGQKVQHTNDSI